MIEDCEHKIASFELARDAARLQSELNAARTRIAELERVGRAFSEIAMQTKESAEQSIALHQATTTALLARAASAEKALAEARERIEKLEVTQYAGWNSLASVRAQLTAEVANRVASEASNVALREALEHCKREHWCDDDCGSDARRRDAALSSPSPGAPLLAALREAREALEFVEMEPIGEQHQRVLAALAKIREVLGE